MCQEGWQSEESFEDGFHYQVIKKAFYLFFRYFFTQHVVVYTGSGS